MRCEAPPCVAPDVHAATDGLPFFGRRRAQSALPQGVAPVAGGDDAERERNEPVAVLVESRAQTFRLLGVRLRCHELDGGVRQRKESTLGTERRMLPRHDGGTPSTRW